MKTKLSAKIWCAIALFGLIGQIAWVVENMYLNVFIYKMFRASASDISLMVAASAIAATLTTVFIGVDGGEVEDIAFFQSNIQCRYLINRIRADLPVLWCR